MVMVYYTRVEHLLIEKRAERYGISKAEYARHKSLDEDMKPLLTPEERVFFNNLSGMAKNLNQLTRSVHRGEALTRDIQECLAGVKSALNKLR